MFTSPKPILSLHLEIMKKEFSTKKNEFQTQFFSKKKKVIDSLEKEDSILIKTNKVINLLTMELNTLKEDEEKWKTKIMEILSTNLELPESEYLVSEIIENIEKKDDLSGMPENVFDLNVEGDNNVEDEEQNREMYEEQKKESPQNIKFEDQFG